MFNQPLTPVAGSLPLSFVIAALPIVVVLVLLGIAQRPAWQASLAGLIVGLVIALGVWRFPASLALAAVANGAAFALLPVIWIVVNALLLYHLAAAAGRIDAFRDWILVHLPDDRRSVLVVVAFCFGALLEGIAGGGTPVAITSSLLIMVGFRPLEALTYTLIFNTTPVAFGGFGVPITVLGAVTNLPTVVLGQEVGRQLPVFSFILPFYVVALYGGRRSLAAVWPMLLIAGGSFALTQFVVSNYVNYALTDVLSSLVSLIVTVGFLKIWRPAHDPDYAIASRIRDGARHETLSPWSAWLPWVLVSAVVIAWTVLGIFLIGDVKIPWPGLHKAVFITLYNKPYAAIWDFQPLGTGTAILLSAVIAAGLMGVGPRGFARAVVATWQQIWLAMLTVILIVGLAYLMNYSGMTYTLGLGVASLGLLFPLVSPFLGWVGVFLSGTDAASNALFGNLQVVAANQLHLDPVLIAATNSSGGVMGKMISPQNIAVGVSTTALKGREGVVLARTFVHSVVFTLLVGILLLVQQYIIP
ncbi:MAG: L-lactate permease [Acidibrevibacterium sp.]|jgi:lactate permease|uniref:L-lactate permease n=1 Tax=Acidibrevibacterium fodinaquatile TaxID=1969806 RepID=UPI0023A7BA04|nr:L-lactate permease [Acidibrevibacterium fodinaquatile]MCA7121057.1 L-lactate permease [Acidibrevibacterium fodinaquatile]